MSENEKTESKMIEETGTAANVGADKAAKAVAGTGSAAANDAGAQSGVTDETIQIPRAKIAPATDADLEVPKPVFGVMDALRKAGGHVMAAGPCVRDTLLGKTPGIWDLYCNLSLEKMAAFLDAGEVNKDSIIIRVNETEKRQGMWIRIHSLSLPLPEFLQEKDFTLNAIGYDPRFGFIDPEEGRQDMADGIIRIIGAPGRKFHESPRSMFDAIILAANYGFVLEKEANQAIRRTARDLMDSPIFVRAELMDGLADLLDSDHAGEALRMMIQTELILAITGSAGVFQELAATRRLERLADRIDEVDQGGLIRLGLFFLAMGQSIGLQAEANLPFEDETHLRMQDILTRMETLVVLPDKAAFKSFLGMLGRGRYEYLENLATWRGFVTDTNVPNQKQRQKFYQEIEENHEPVFRSDLAIGLGDLRTIGIEGAAAENVIRQLLSEIHHYPEKNNKEDLLFLASRFSKRGAFSRISRSRLKDLFK